VAAVRKDGGEELDIFLFLSFHFFKAKQKADRIEAKAKQRQEKKRKKRGEKKGKVRGEQARVVQKKNSSISPSLFLFLPIQLSKSQHSLPCAVFMRCYTSKKLGNKKRQRAKTSISSLLLLLLLLLLHRTRPLAGPSSRRGGWTTPGWSSRA